VGGQWESRVLSDEGGVGTGGGVLCALRDDGGCAACYVVEGKEGCRCQGGGVKLN
jgi:hypothetical protein